MKLLDISIVFPNFNGILETTELLNSIAKLNYPKNKFEVIVVDDASTDNSANKIAKKFPSVKMIRLKKNRGPAFARNAGIKAAKFENILSLDNDTQIPKDFLQDLNRCRFQHPNSIIGAQIIDKKTNKLVSTGYSYNLWTATESGLRKYDKDTIVDFAPAAAMFFNKKAAKFDARFNFFYEDADFCFQARQNGIKTIHCPKLAVRHGKTTQAFNPEKKYYLYYLCKFKFIFKHHDFWQKISAIIFQLLIIPIWKYLIYDYKLENIKLSKKSDYWKLRYRAFFDCIKKESVF